MLDRITEKLYNNVVKVKFRYDKFGNLYEKQDLFTNTTYRYNYDLSGRITGITGSDNTSLNYVYDEFNRVEKYVAKFGSNSNTTEYIYGDSSVDGQKDGLVYGVKQNGTQRLSYTYDKLARLDTRTINTTTPFVTQYTYHNGATQSNTTTLIQTLQNGSDVFEYLYDASYNIGQIKFNGQIYSRYTYDELNQLQKEKINGYTYTYTYDNGGNIQSVKKNGQLLKDYSYTDENWPDLLTGFNGQTITYDEIGNPLQYRDGFEFEWSNGRQLTTVTEDTLETTYTYNADGLRTTKNQYGMFLTQYYWVDGVLLGEKTNNKYTIFLYDDTGTPYGMIYNGTYYYYAYNVQGDIVALIDADGEIVARYFYDAWGNTISMLDGNGNSVLSNGGHIAHKNPLRYRGYYYDEETEFYYLQSRYYDPVTCRFINADTQLNGNSILGYNLFAYCENNPIMYVDPTGHSLLAIIGLSILIVGMAIGLSGSEPVNSTSNNNVQLSTNKEPIDPTKPPPPESGYVPPKKNPNPGKVKNPNGAGKGWPSNNGGVWVPNNNQDGGPGWTVQFPNGRHEHRYPNGNVRAHKFTNSDYNITNLFLGGTIIFGTGIGIIVIIADDATGVGTLDDASLPALISAFAKGVKLVAG